MLPERRATAAIAVQFAVNGAFFASFVPRLPELRDRIGISTESIGVLLTVASAAGLLASASVRWVVARLGTQRVLLFGGLAIAVALTGVGLATNVVAAVPALAAMFALDVYVDVAMNMHGASLSARRTRSMMNRLHALWSVGSVVGGGIAASLAKAGVSLTAHLVGAAVVLAVLSTVVALQLPPMDEPETDTTDTTTVLPASGGRRGRPLALFFVAGLSAVVIETVAINWAPFRITDDLHGTASTSALAFVAVVGGMTIARFAGDHLASFWRADRFMIASAVLAVAGLVTAGVVPEVALAVGAFAVAGLGIATLTPRLYESAAHAGAGTASGLGVLTAGMRTATIVAPIGIASLASATSVGTAIAVVASVAGAAFITAARS